MYYLEHQGPGRICFSRQRNREIKLKYLKRLVDNNNICLQEVHGKDEFLQAIQVLSPRFRLFGTFLPDNENAGGSAICIQRDLLPKEATVTHLIACRGRDRLVNIRTGRHGLVLSTSISDLNLPCSGCVAGCVLFARAGLFVLVLWALFWVIPASVIRKKDDSLFGTSHSPMATRERLLCSILPVHTSLRLPKLITQEETPLPFVSYALFLGLIFFYQSTHG